MERNFAFLYIAKTMVHHHLEQIVGNIEGHTAHIPPLKNVLSYEFFFLKKRRRISRMKRIDNPMYLYQSGDEEEKQP
jgi:hypothetical protein